MRKIILFFNLFSIIFTPSRTDIADHTIVDRFDDIPQQYIDLVKKMWVTVPGESHSSAYRAGMELLETRYPAYAVSVVGSGTPNHLPVQT